MSYTDDRLKSSDGLFAPLPELEAELIRQGHTVICGTDEAGRGPLAGPVVAAAVIYVDSPVMLRVRDSKQLSPLQREGLYHELIEQVSYAVGTSTTEEIDTVNILKASLTAMARAVAALPVRPNIVLVDGRHRPPLNVSTQAIVRGDGRVRVISAASIIAKVTRDRLMRDFHDRYPGYGFDRHFGYPTAAHLQALRELGPCAIHRKTFRGVRELLEASVSR